MPSEDSLPGLPVDWAAPPAVRAFMSTRAGGVSLAPYDSLNLARGVGDEPAAVAENRRRIAQAIGAQPAWLRQVHGASVVDAAEALAAQEPPAADASFTCEPGVACVVMVADCLPVLFAASNAKAVGAAHAGWRGLAAGVLENTLAAVAASAGCDRSEVIAWLGPCIGPRQFEVGDDVREAFGAAAEPHFRPHRRQDGSAAWLADLPGLARQRLAACGVLSVSGGCWCTVEDESRFFSYRRLRVSGRMAAGIALLGP